MILEEEFENATMLHEHVVPELVAAVAKPIWNNDDISHYFQKNYLQTAFPLATCGLSILNIIVRTTTALIPSRSRKEHQLLVDVEEEDLTLQKIITNVSTYDVDKPKAEIGVVAFEAVLSAAQLAISVTALFYDEKTVARVSIAYIILWSYLLLLTVLRLCFTTVQKQVSFLKLWNQSAILYGLEWLCEVMVFRSALIHPRASISRAIVVARFALTCALCVTVLVSRRGNRAVTLEYEGDIEPSKEPLASLLGQLTFAWTDGIVWRGWKRPLEMTDVWNVAAKDKAELVLEHFRQIKKTHMLAVRLLLFFKKQLILQGLWCAISSIAMFMPTLLLKAILEYIEDPQSTTTNAAWLYAILLFVTGVIQALGDGQSLWIGRRICIQIRAVIVGEVYSKVLKRKAAASAEADPKEEEMSKSKSWWKKLFSQKKDVQSKMNGHTDKKETPAKAASNGTVINLMSIDSFKVAEISAYLHFLWAATPVQLIMAVGLLYKVLGYSSFAGIILMVLVLPWNMWIAKSFTKAQKAIMTATDARIHATNEVLQNIRIIKYFAWEQRFEHNVNEKRQTEITALWRKYILWASAYTMWGGVPIIITFTSFLIFTKVEKRPLVPSIAFPALSMFSLLRIPLDQLADMVAHVQESKVSVDRIEEFLKEEETEKYLQLRNSKQASPHDTKIALEHATLTWGSKSDPAKTSSKTFRLIDMNIEFIVGKLNVIAGMTGCGKTSLLMALLGEMQLLDGLVHIPGGYSRQQLRSDPRTGLTESVAYCAQQAWLVNDTIKENILFSSPFDARRYSAVIAACALKRDLEILDAGDHTLVGEKGITLSGGQKQRISLARALYSNSRHLMLDDCLSAVDSHTAKHIFDEAIMGKLMENRTCILVSHNVALTVPQASHVVVLKNGKILVQGLPLDVMESGHLGEEMAKSVPASRMASAAPSRVPSPQIESEEHEATNDVSDGPTITGELDVPDESGFKADRKFVDTRIETKATGSVKWTTIQMYLQAMGPWYYWIFAVSGFVAVQVGSVATNVWIREWANAYHTSSRSAHILISMFQTQQFHGTSVAGGPRFHGVPASYSNQVLTQAHDKVDSTYYLGVYALIGTAYIIICFSRELLLFSGSLQASKVLHQRLLGKILRATFRFFDSTPLGQLTNRFSKDLQSIDQEVAPVAIGLLHSAASVVTIVVLISSITPGFLIPGAFIAIIYVLTGMFYIQASRDLKRLESVQRSPLFQHFGETLSGVVTIRAYGDEARFVNDSHQKVNTHNRPFIYLWATNRWLAFRVDCAGALVAFFSAMFVVQNVGKIDAGAAGLSLSYAITFTQNVLWLVRLYAANEQNMNAVERVQEYIDVEQEAPAHIEETTPAANWPSQGAVEFINYSTSYRKDLDAVLKNVTFKISAGEKVGIVGRTGAGKSSLALALFRGLEAQDGKILIDSVDIGLIGLQDLREAITIVPQDPTLFTGTLRSNLDPFELFTDEEIFTALRRVQLIGSARKPSVTSPYLPSNGFTLNGILDLQSTNHDSPSANDTVSSTAPTLVRFQSNAKDNANVFYDLNTQIAESGSNLSQGQRQLLCLARALLKAPKVLIMDEATASIDYATDSNIQDTLRELEDSTIITIAHRLQTIIDYDKVLVLDKGEVVEYAHPWELIQKEGGSFRGMCETSGDLEVLLDLARKAWDSSRLVDV